MNDTLYGRCATCGYEIRHLGGVSWRHTVKVGGRNHAADPDDTTRVKLAEAAR